MFNIDEVLNEMKKLKSYDFEELFEMYDEPFCYSHGRNGIDPPLEIHETIIDNATNIVLKHANNSFTKSYIKKRLWNMILKHQYRSTSLNELIKENLDEIREDLGLLRKELKEKPDEWTFYYPIEGLKLESNMIISNVELMPYQQFKKELSDKNLSQKSFFKKKFSLFPKQKILNLFNLNNLNFWPQNDKYKKIEKHLKDNGISSEDYIYAKTNASGIKNLAIETSTHNINLILNILKMGISPHDIHKDTPYNIIKIKNKFSVVILNQQSFEILISPHYKNISFPNQIPIKDQIETLSKKEEPSFIEKRILFSAHWFGEALSVKIPNFEEQYIKKDSLEALKYYKLGERMIKLFTSLESLLIFNNKNLVENISKRTGFLVGTNSSQEKFIEERVKELYEVRSRIVHGSTTNVSIKDSYELECYIRFVLSNLSTIIHNCNLKSKNDLKKFFKAVEEENPKIIKIKGLYKRNQGHN